MHASRTFMRDYTRLIVLLALPVALVLAAKLFLGVLPTHQYHPGSIVFNGEQLLLLVHVGTDLLTGLSYIWISAVLGWLVYRVRDALPYHTVMLAFSAFIISCGANHLAHAWTMFWPNYWIEAVIKGVMAVASVATALAIWPVVPPVIRLVRAAQLSERRAAEIQSRDEFLSVAAHEIRTPITAIQGYTQLLQSTTGPTLEPRSQGMLAVIAEQTQRLTGLVESMLDLSRIETGRFQVELAPVSLSCLVERLVEERRLIVPPLHTLKLAQNAGELHIVGDERRLAQVLDNLIGNAIKYSPYGGEITVTLERSGRQAQLSVADQGIGIPADSLPHLFDRFYRAGNADEKGVLPGFGIGLFVVKEIIAQHGGEMRVSSVEGKGSTFTVLLPLV